MKKVIIQIIVVFCSIFTFAQQEGVISYKETVKLEFNIDLEVMDLELPESKTSYKDLYFNHSESVYKESEEEFEEDLEVENENAIIKILMSQDDGIERILYINQNEKQILEHTGFFGKEFLIAQNSPEFKWKVTGEKVKYLGYECMKATTTHEGKYVVAWFAPQISAQIGPNKYGQLPGAILMLSEGNGKIEIKATKITLEVLSEKIEKPKKGKKVTREEYDKIVEEKLKEMKGSKRTTIIRG